ncbi:MAG: rRNA methyltransferase [Rhodospirillaceae bacterium]|nr:rRNA methyltransferase [Rhodospirillaceae bacterium]
MVNDQPTKREANLNTPSGAPVIILVETSLAENIGMTARAMMNFGFTELRLVRPKCKWPNSKAINASSGAHSILTQTKIFKSTSEAVADLNRVGATTARLRDMIKPVKDPRGWAGVVRNSDVDRVRCGILFGAERVGLHNDDLALADTLITVPTNPAFSSLNLAQTVLLICYEIQMAGDVEIPSEIRRKGRGASLANQKEIIDFYEHLEEQLDKAGFLRVKEKRPRMIRNIRNIFNRALMTEQEVRTLRGVIVALTEKIRKP